MDWHHPDSQGNTLDFPDNVGAWDLLEDWVMDDSKENDMSIICRIKLFRKWRNYSLRTYRDRMV